MCPTCISFAIFGLEKSIAIRSYLSYYGEGGKF